MKIEISIVIAWNGSARSPKSARSSESARSPEHKSLNKCLEALLAPRMRLTRPSPSVQVILSIGSKPRGMKVDSYLDDLNRSSVELIQFDEPVSLPLLRQAGIEKAQGDVIVMLDPYAIVEENWLEELREAHARHPHLAIGGAVGL
ncbi:MAG: glycosyltransferase family 2 protein, partial [Anaerolineales bacterium]